MQQVNSGKMKKRRVILDDDDDEKKMVSSKINHQMSVPHATAETGNDDESYENNEVINGIINENFEKADDEKSDDESVDEEIIKRLSLMKSQQQQ